MTEILCDIAKYALPDEHVEAHVAGQMADFDFTSECRARDTFRIRHDSNKAIFNIALCFSDDIVVHGELGAVKGVFARIYHFCHPDDSPPDDLEVMMEISGLIVGHGLAVWHTAQLRRFHDIALHWLTHSSDDLASAWLGLAARMAL